MIKTYETFTFENAPDWDKVPEGRVDCFQWESKEKYRPETHFKMCFVKRQGIYVQMRTDEKNIRAVCKNRDESTWEDSCMEFFVRPFANRAEYMNFEFNPNGAYLCEVGKSKFDRKFIGTVTELEILVKTKVDSYGWHGELFIPCNFIEAVYGEKFTAESCEIFGNFYKCGDKTDIPHYGSFSPMTTLPPGFHNPECFAKIIVKDSFINENQ